MTTAFYRVTLQPLQSMMFGGNETHGDESLDETSNYYVRSMKFPQQSTILGVLRQEILKAHQVWKPVYADYSNAEKEKHRELIGQHFGDVFENNSRLEAGLINRISPLFITDGERSLFPMPLDDHGFVAREMDNPLQKMFGNDGRVQFLLKNYDSKKGSIHQDAWGDQSGHLHSDQIFTTEQLIGIRRTMKTINQVRHVQIGDQEGGFYMQERILLKPSFTYATYLETNQAIHLPKTSIVEIGGDRAKCVMRCEQLKDEPELFGLLSIPQTDDKIRLTLLSDAIFESNMLSKIDCMVSQSINFRTLEGSGPRKKKSSIQYELLKRGSVLFVTASVAKEITEIWRTKYSKAHQMGFGYAKLSIIKNN